jgi:hypothetical protein
MTEWSRFELGGFTFTASPPDSAAALEEGVEEIITERGLKEHDDVPGTP